MIAGYAVGYAGDNGKVTLYGMVGRTEAEGQACMIVATLEYPYTFGDGKAILYELHRPDPAAVDEVRVTTSGTMDNLPPAPVPEVKP